jgi:hypothetical protein
MSRDPLFFIRQNYYEKVIGHPTLANREIKPDHIKRRNGRFIRNVYFIGRQIFIQKINGISKDLFKIKTIGSGENF